MFANSIVVALCIVGTIIDYILYIIKCVMWRIIQWIVSEDRLKLNNVNFKTFAQYYKEIWGEEL